ncbi:MAG: hypothetical protein ABIV25_09090, partial [Paracoccaceae bacterium]
IASYDYADHVLIQTRDHPETRSIPADTVEVGRRNAVEYLLGCIAHGQPLVGPLHPRISLIGQRIVDTAAQSAREKRTLTLIG